MSEPYRHCACGHTIYAHEPPDASKACFHDCGCRGYVECHCNGEGNFDAGVSQRGEQQ